MPENEDIRPPILADKHYDAPSAFTPESLLREAHRHQYYFEGINRAVRFLEQNPKAPSG
jgi:hypothetical protein